MVWLGVCKLAQVKRPYIPMIFSSLNMGQEFNAYDWDVNWIGNLS